MERRRTPSHRIRNLVRSHDSAFHPKHLSYKWFLLANIMLDDLDKELDNREHKFCRYADDCNIYVKSRKAGERVMESISKFIEKKLKLKVNKNKSAVDMPCKRKFLSFSFYYKKGKIGIRAHEKSNTKWYIRATQKYNKHRRTNSK